MNVGDLVRMKTHDTGFVGIVVEVHGTTRGRIQAGIKWFSPHFTKINWEPDGWLEVLSECR